MLGWIKVFRKILNHWLWEDKPFARGQAYIDIVLKANHSENTKCFNGNLITINRGEIITSIRELCTDWGWSNSKVKKFLTMLEADKMIEVKSDTKKTVIKVLNYGKYQGVDNVKNDTETSQKHIKSISEAYQKHTNKNDKNVKNIKNEKNERDKKSFGKYKNILLAHSEYTELKSKYADCDRLIEELSSYMQSEGKRYEDHFATLERWAKREAEKNSKGKLKTPATYDLSDYAKFASENTEI